MTIKKLKDSILLKVIFNGFMVIGLLIPLFMVSDIVSEREKRRGEAEREVSGKWGFSQRVTGPILTIPYKIYYKDKKNILRMKIKNAYFLPRSLKIDGKITPEKRSRGLYEVMLYKLENLKISGAFNYPDFKKLRISNKNVLWDEAFITMGIPDTRGIQKEVVLRWNGRKISFSPGVKGSSIYSSGIHANIKKLEKRSLLKFKFHLNLQGSSSLSFIPIGKETIVDIESTWKHPSFFGSYLPTKRKITSRGFRANWKISYFGRNFPQEWTDSTKPSMSSMYNSSFGVKIYMPVDFYQKCVRAVKYGFLFISLTFLCFFLFEILNKLNIHPLQYLLIGSAMCLFYLLFLSLSEHMNFILSYILSSLGVIGMIAGYSYKILKSKSSVVSMTVFLVFLYGYLFILLQNQDYALVLGSLALFAILGLVMYLTRNIDWYNLKFKAEG
ncbi:cell envelope integrity protein CreD [Spirochaetota bacterium]